MGLALHEVPLPMGSFPAAPGFLLELLNMCSVQKTEQSPTATHHPTARSHSPTQF